MARQFDKRRRVLVQLLAALLAAGAAHGATLRPQAQLEGAQVRLADLFDGLGPEGQRALGPSPAPGSRIVVEAAQLGAIARQFGVDWRPASPADRAVLDRPGQMLARAPLLEAVRKALKGLGVGEDVEIELPGYSAPMIPTGATADIAIEQLDWDAATGRFAGQVAIVAEGMPLLRQRIAGTAQEMVLVPVASHRLNAGSVVGDEDLRMARVRAPSAREEIALEPGQALGMTARRQIMPGQPIRLADLQRTAAVMKGAKVTMRVRAGGLNATAVGQALAAGSVGDRIPVRNILSRTVVEAEVLGHDQVRVEPGAVPLETDGRSAQLNFTRGTP